MRSQSRHGRWPQEAHHRGKLPARFKTPPSRSMTLCRDPRRMEGTPLQLAPVWDSGWGKYNAKVGTYAASRC